MLKRGGRGGGGRGNRKRGKAKQKIENLGNQPRDFRKRGNIFFYFFFLNFFFLFFCFFEKGEMTHVEDTIHFLFLFFFSPVK